ncbi:MAG TPA: BTAD domain-containing putative transcriptional regulator [Allocoleopsis sp.]
MPPSLQIKLLGEFCLTYSGNAIASVNSERLQAMLAYILLHRDAPQPRQQIAVQLWPDAPDTEAKANLRRRLHELRQVLPDADRVLQVGTKTLQWVSDAPYSLDVADFEIAIAKSKQAQQSKNLSEAQQALEQAAELYPGKLLPSCYDDWIVPKRELLQQQAINGLDKLVTLLSEQGDSRTAIGYAQRLLRLDPLYETAYCHLMRLHAQEGDRASALRVYHQCMTVLREELGVNPSPVTCKLYEQLLTMEDAPAESTCVAAAKPLFSATTLPQVKTASSSQPSHLPLIGRESEWAIVQQWMSACRNKASSDLILILGEPGIGKTRLLEELAQPIRDEGGYVLWGRGFEAEMLLPYGAWGDAFRSIAAHDFLAELASLLLDTTSSPGALDRGRLFDTAVQFIAKLVENNAPVLVVLDDIQWLDETSIAFLHYVARLLSNVPVLFACAARKRELEDNVSAYKFWQAFHREHRVRVLELTPLDRTHTAELAHTLGTEIDGDRVFTDSGGNPLFALEIARALSQSDAYSGNLETLIQGRLFQLHETARDLVPWAAALGRSFNPTTLAQVTDSSLPRLLTAIEQLEQHGIIRPGTVINGEMVYDFAHDIVRQVAYQQLSEPRRRLIHLHIAQALHALTTSDSALMNDVAHHASLGSNHPLAASASLLAAERCLRVFAYAEASELAQRGIQHCQHLDIRERVRLKLGLLKAYVKAGVTKERASTLQTELQRSIAEASALRRVIN